MGTNYEQETRTLTLTLGGEIDHHTCDEIKKTADYEIQRLSPKKIIFDFKNVRFMDSSGIGMLIGRYKLILRYGGQAEMINLSKDVRRIFEMTGIFKIIPETDAKISDDFQKEVLA
jgi:stage II sporulation protein AA (anti-sigma F factor antagonist)